jgi:ElaB/YqjD/DUF883 family membrane-anchored ribosome-binding protein
MFTRDETKDADRKLEKARSHVIKTDEIQDIKENVVEIARTIRDASNDRAHDAADYVRDRVDGLKASGRDALEKVETRIKARPGQSVAFAFAAGLIASFLLGRRSS